MMIDDHKKWGSYKNIVVIDDCIIHRRLMVKILNKSGFDGELFTFPCAEVFYENKDHYPNLVLSDLCLPGDSGVAIYEYVKNRFPDCKFMIVSGDPFELSRNFNFFKDIKYFVKPIISKKILSEIKLCLS